MTSEKCQFVRSFNTSHLGSGRWRSAGGCMSCMSVSVVTCGCGRSGGRSWGYVVWAWRGQRAVGGATCVCVSVCVCVCVCVCAWERDGHSKGRYNDLNWVTYWLTLLRGWQYTVSGSSLEGTQHRHLSQSKHPSHYHARSLAQTNADHACSHFKLVSWSILTTFFFLTAR
jgi:hypothetical protein